VAAVLLVAGCQTTPKDERSAGQVVDDKNITKQVKHDLDTEPVYKFTDVDVTTYSGIVQLSGFATVEAQKDRAGELAAQVDGVQKVINGISLKPSPTPTGRMNSSSRVYSEPARTTTNTNDPPPSAPQ